MAGLPLHSFQLSPSTCRACARAVRHAQHACALALGAEAPARRPPRRAVPAAQDKQALEHKLREIQNVLEVVQGQRNELRQQYRVRSYS